MQRTIAILPVKSFGAAKQRLGGLVEPEARSILARAMLADVLAALTEVPAIEEVAIVT
ncbi:MAG: 2-phospho-L-lactate guanylyltransferase, partial [Thermoleophilaceae bacterium]|nr:2-phospho-L-lactate guanylyltransferase [Thermoleophilaceae bacterium]